MSVEISHSAFILAAGFGRRLRPLTLERPKPLVEVCGQTLLDHTIGHLKDAGLSHFGVNAHYLGEQVQAHMNVRYGNESTVYYEPEILDTGGGIKQALSLFGGQPFFVVSGDGLWEDGPSGSAIRRMREAWTPEKMDILMLLQPVDTMVLTKGVGDYDLDEQGRATRSRERQGAYMFTSIRINTPSIFDGTPEEPFSYLNLMDEADRRGRLYGLVHDGAWHHISTPEDLAAVSGVFEGSRKLGTCA